MVRTTPLIIGSGRPPTSTTTAYREPLVGFAAANDPRFLAGSFSWDVSEKFQRFIDMCDTFHMPVVNLVDQPGFFIGVKSEEYGTIRKGVRAPLPGARIQTRDHSFRSCGARESQAMVTPFSR